jgi:ribose transport system permease protein
VSEIERPPAESETEEAEAETLRMFSWARGGGQGSGQVKAQRASFSDAAGEFATRYGLVLALLVMFAGFSAARPDTFPDKGNVFAILGTQGTLGILSLAVMLPLIAGEFDLSVGATLGFSAILSIWFIGQSHWSVGLTIAVVVLIGLAVGMINAFFVVVIGLSAFIATLGTATILGGLALYVSGGQVLFSGLPTSFTNLGQWKVGGLPVPFLYFLGLVVVVWYLLEHTPFGRLLTAVGLGRSPAKLAGVRVRLLITVSFLLAGGLAAVAGVIQAAQLASASPTGGPDALLPAFAGAFLGATTIKRGQFNAWGTFVGVYFLAIGISGLQQLGLPYWFSPVFNGLALLIAVSGTALLARRRRVGDED